MARRSGRWAVITLLLAGGAWALYTVVESLADLGPDLSANQFLLPALSLLLVALVLAVAGMLVRNLVRLIVDRKRGLLGSRLRTKLVFFFLALVLLPAVVLFSGSAQLIKKTVEAILRTPLEDLTRQSGDLVAQWRVYLEQETLHKARTVAGEIDAGSLLAPEAGERLELLLERARERHSLDLIRVGRQGMALRSIGAFPGAPAAVDDPMTRAVVDLEAEAARTGEAVVRSARLGERLVAEAAVPLPAAADGAAPVVITVAVVLPASLSGNLEGFSAANQAYRQFRAQRKDLVRFYLMQVALIFLVTVFIATWIGFYLSRRITDPIQEMAAAAREISQGNLQVRVRSAVGDEVGTLVDAFNDMAVELEESREVINRSTAELYRSNRQLEERRRYIETLLGNLSTAVISLDPAGRVTTANPAVRRILGIDMPPGGLAREILCKQGLEPLAELLDLPVGNGIKRELSLERAGRDLQLAVQVSPMLGDDGEGLGTLVMVEDLSDLVRAQRAAAWREVARRIAHEIKNPLTPIQLAAQRLRRKFETGAADLAQVVPDATSAIEREVGTLKRLVDEFSRFARMPELAPRPVDFRGVVESVVSLYKPLGQAIEWRVELAGELGEVVVDDEQMRRALINLIDNAVAAMGGRGTIAISARRDPEGTLRVEVADSGPGIPPGDRGKMFVPYFSTKKRGTGLGLAIVHKVISDHGGTIRVEDNVPHGARFVIDLPSRRGVEVRST